MRLVEIAVLPPRLSQSQASPQSPPGLFTSEIKSLQNMAKQATGCQAFLPLIRVRLRILKMRHKSVKGRVLSRI